MASDLKTIRDYLEIAAREKANQPALRFKRTGEWHSWTFKELASHAAVVADVAARVAHVRPGQHVALLAENGPEWVSVYLGLTGMGATVVHIDPKLREGEISHILRDSGAVAIFCGARQMAEITDCCGTLTDLRHGFILPPDATVLPDQARPTWHLFESVRDSLASRIDGAQSAWTIQRPAVDDVASLIYTSGTTGLPKGAVLTHANFSADVEASLDVLKVREDDDFLVVLPLHHAFGFMGNLMIPLATGCCATFVESLRTVGDNLRECSPTILLAVPLLVEKLYGRMMNGIQSSPIGRLLNFVGMMSLLRKKVSEKLGGRLRLIISGGAPCPPHLVSGLQRLGVTLIEGYGLTETSPVATLSPPEAYRPGTVGRALPGVEIRIEEPNAEGVGEIAIRGPIVMQEYYRHPDATAAVFDGDWFLTGDLGRMAEDGTVSIAGRKKNVIVNREGKNIYPEEVEAVVNRHPWVLESVVCGFRDQDDGGERVGIIVVPDFETMATDREASGAIRDAEKLKALMRKAVQTGCERLSSYKRPRRILVRTEAFDKTPTQKIKRYLYRFDAMNID